MALVLPVLRLWLLLLNVYTTFKAMKPPPQSQRSVRTKSGPSARAMQLRKRELKSCLAIWMVWSVFSTIERVLDRTIGLVTPFYNEFKSLVVLFLLVARAHGAEAIFLHVIHPLLRPYVPAIDDILAHLHSASDLFLLLFSLPVEYVTYRWRQWSWSTTTEEDDDQPPVDHEDEGGGVAVSEQRRVLRPRNESHRIRMMEADRQARAVFQDINDAQGRVRARAQYQPAATAPHDGRGKHLRSADSDVAVVGLRTRKRVLEYPATEGQTQGPGSSTTRVHHIYRRAIDELPPPPSLQPFPILPNAPTTQPVPLPSNPLPTPPQPSTSTSSGYQIWHPPRAAFEDLVDVPRGTPSPVYPPLPAAYPLTPRRSDPLPLPLPPRIINPPHLVTPIPRRVSAGASSSRRALDVTGGVDKRTGRSNQARTMRTARPLASLEHATQGGMEAEDFFGHALEPSIQVAEMDIDTENLSTSSSASEVDIKAPRGERRGDVARTGNDEIFKGKRGLRKEGLDVKKGKRKATGPVEPLRRSTRKRRDESPGVETDEFGFTIRHTSDTIGSRATASTSGPSEMTGYSTARQPKKPLARTKPAPKPDEDETVSSDEESEKKRQRLDSGFETALDDEALEDDGISVQDEFESISLPNRGGVRDGRREKNPGVRTVEEPKATRKPKQNEVLPTRATRASTRQVVSAKGNKRTG